MIGLRGFPNEAMAFSVTAAKVTTAKVTAAKVDEQVSNYRVSHPRPAPSENRNRPENRLAAMLTLIPSINAPLNASIDTFNGVKVWQRCRGLTKPGCTG
jgi:hypothetical protein